MKPLEPHRPTSIDPLAAEVLELLSNRSEAGEIVLGGYFALKHYYDFRATHDIDAWWKTGVKQATVHVLRDAMQSLAKSHNLAYGEREFGDTLSLEMTTGKKSVFSFQISVRSVELEPPIPSPYAPIAIETLADNIGAKMSALVNRGLPRDFIDIHSVVSGRIVTAAECWRLWQRKNAQITLSLARKQVVKHLTNIELRRPLDTIRDLNERKAAQEIRLFFKHSFVREPNIDIDEL